ncbi:hypothetical protein Leryth_005973 [Lithospermum erythrorhizon]|nr:hypothetical protein Leryth_005973 [Lithospermum erythrorhizon]
MASVGSGRGGSKGFDFASDDILCSYQDLVPNNNNQDDSNSDPSIPPYSKEFQKSRMSKSSMFPSGSYSPPEESSMNQDMISAVERSMKKHSDNMMRFLEGLSSRLSQLELYCYNLDKSIGEMRSDLDRDHGEADLKLKSIEKHLHEVHRSVQILRDKQELAETQKELAKLQLAQVGSSTKGSVQQNEEKAASQEAEKSDNSSDMHGQQLALALPHQLAPQPSLPSRPEQPQQPPQVAAPPMPSQSMTQTQAYYLPPSQMTTLQGPNQASQGQYMSSSSHYQGSQMQDMSRIAPHQTQSQVNQPSQVQPVANYQHQWS